MLRIYITRHGQDTDNLAGILNGHRNTLLTNLGREQALTISNKINENNLVFDAVYSSPLNRTFETANIISLIANTPNPKVNPLLIERELGDMTGKKIADIEKLCTPHIVKTNITTYFTNAEGAETFPELLKRGSVLLKKINKKYSSGNILLVTHGDIGKMIYASYYNLDWKSTLQKFHFGNCELLLLAKDSPPESTRIFDIKQYNP